MQSPGIQPVLLEACVRSRFTGKLELESDPQVHPLKGILPILHVLGFLSRVSPAEA